MYSIKKVAELINGVISGDENLKIERIAPFYEATENEITFASDEKFLKNLDKTEAKVIIIPDMDIELKGKTFIKVSSNPRSLMPKILDFFKKKIKKIEKSREDGVKLGENVDISPNCYIGHNVEIGDNTFIYPNVVILEGAKIGENCTIYPNVTIREDSIIGNRVIIQPGAVIGSDGFGYATMGKKHYKIDQIGRVVIGDSCEIGANTTIDRGTIGDTIIKKGTKLDNLVHIAHNDKLGENCLLTAHVGIAGSTTIGDNVTIGGQSGVSGHIVLGDNITIAARSGVTKSLSSNQILSGYPVTNFKDDMRIKSAMKKLPNLLKEVKLIKKRLED